jgi:sodium transport system permease protein
MKTILTVIRKELLDTLRDRRTLLMSVVLPAVAIPLLMFAAVKIQSAMMKKDITKTLTVGLVSAPEAFYQQLTQDSSLAVRQVEEAAGRQAVASGDLDALLAFPANFTQSIEDMQPAEVQFYFKSTNSQVQGRLSTRLDAYRQTLMDDRMVQLNVAPETLAPLKVTEQNLASSRERVGQVAGGFLPYLFLVLCFLGCMYPALDLISGEKERGTLETLLTVPSSRLHILLGKMIVIALMGLAAALVAVVGMAVGVNFLPQIPPELLSTINGVLSASFIATLVLMLVPLALFFSGLLTAVVVRARNFKEAQSLVSPISFAIIVPAALAMLPGLELNWQTVWIPILNIALATKAAVANTLDPAHLVAIVFSLTVLAFIAVAISIRQFSQEATVLR